MPAKLILEEDSLAVDLSECRGSAFSDALAKVKDIPGRRYDGKRKLWSLPAEPLIAERALQSLGAECSPELREWISAGKVQADVELASAIADDADDLLLPWATERSNWQPLTVNGSPFTGLKPHQRALVSAVVAENDEIRAVIADDMGLGKTIQCIAIVAEWALRHPKALDGPKLIVCPNSVKGVWERELRRWLGEYVPVVVVPGGATPARREKAILDGILDNAWVVVNYEQLRTIKVKRKLRNGGTKTEEVMKLPVLGSTAWQVVIADEAHRAKNRKAAQTRGLYRCRGTIMLAATGTPIMNEPAELWSILHWLFPREYSSYWRFFEQYVEYTEGFMGKVITGVRNPDALRFELHSRLFRRTKALLDLPEKTRIFEAVTLSPKARKLYKEAEKGLWLEIEQAVDSDPAARKLAEAALAGDPNIYAIPNAAARTVRLRQILSTPALLGGEDDSDKLDACEEKITDNKHKQHVVFSEFVGTCNIFANRLRKHGLIVAVYTGETTQLARTRLEDEFQRGEIDVMVGTIGAMREGISLQAADTQHWIERAWVPAWNEQGEARCHRMGTKNAVTIYIYEAVGTIDDGRVSPTNRLKERLVGTVIQQDPVNERRS